MATAILTKWGNGQGIRIPKLFCDQLGLVPGDTVEFELAESEIRIVKVAKSPQTLAELFAGYSGDYRPEEWDIGEPVGKEMW